MKLLGDIGRAVGLETVSTEFAGRSHIRSASTTVSTLAVLLTAGERAAKRAELTPLQKSGIALELRPSYGMGDFYRVYAPVPSGGGYDSWTAGRKALVIVMLADQYDTDVDHTTQAPASDRITRMLTKAFGELKSSGKV